MQVTYQSLLALESNVLVLSRRFFVRLALAGLACGSAGARVAVGRPESADGQIAPSLLLRALDALERHHDSIIYRDFIGVADFSLPSRAPRFHLVNLADGSVRSHLVAHGRGSDPSHTGWLERFSNEPRSNATSAGAYRTGSLYVGAHGHSIRLEGLDPTNSNALSRAIVVHGAWYVNEAVIGHSGMLGRSQGCFAVADSSLPEIMTALRSGRLIYADKSPS
jgi:L,D-transpeptidase catalytic domain